jgi:hypothetical protein
MPAAPARDSVPHSIATTSCSHLKSLADRHGVLRAVVTLPTLWRVRVVGSGPNDGNLQRRRRAVGSRDNTVKRVRQMCVVCVCVR